MNVFLVEEAWTGQVPLAAALTDGGHAIVQNACLDHAILLEIAMHASVELVIFNLRVMDREVLRKICAVSEVRPLPVIVFVADSDAETTRLAIKSGISAYIIDGLETERLQPVIDLAVARFEEIRCLHQEVDLLKRQLQERKLVERAKGVLMKYARMSEEEAYTTLRKRSMDQNTRIAQVALEVITASELLHTQPDKACM